MLNTKRIVCVFMLMTALIFFSSMGLVIAQEDVTPFVEVTASAGLIKPRAVTDGEKVTGQAWGDYDRDGWLDIYLTDTDGKNTLYHNNKDGTFSMSPWDAQVALPDALSGGAIFADYDNDGWPDLYVLNWGTNTLFHNEAGQGFADVTELAGVGDGSNGKTAAWGDFDADGYLDLYVANWSCVPKCGRSFEGDKDMLYHNNGDGTFTDVTSYLGGGKTRGAGFVASFVDFDNDGDLDIYLVNDEFINPVGNGLWRNDGPGCDGWCFTEISEEAGADTRVMGMGLATADYDRDGDLDFYFSNAGPMTLLQNQGDGTFGNVAELSGVDFPQGVGWGSVFFDYDNDGWQDLYLAIMEGVGGSQPPNPLFKNNGDGSFTNLDSRSGAGDTGRSIGVAYADYDNDGWVDLVVGNYDEGYHLYRNQAGEFTPHHWLAVHLVGGGPVNRDAVGTRVWVTDQFGHTQLQEVKNGSSLGSGDTLLLHFGLGEAQVDKVEVLWPDGTVQQIEDMPVNERHEIVYGQELDSSPAFPTDLMIGVSLLLVFVVGSLFWYKGLGKSDHEMD